MSSKYALEVKNVSKSFRLPTEQASGIKQAVINRFKGIKGYKEQKVLQDISFEVEKGDFFGIVGRNGSGKSTLLKLISQIYVPDSGEIKVQGKLVPFIELGVGFNPELTGRENVYMNGALLGFSPSEVDEMYDEIVEFAELPDFMDQKLKNYSSGMQVRLAFSIAIKAQGDILVLDEVLAVGDEAFQRKCYNYFAQLKKEKKTVILVTHSMESAKRFCNKVALIDKNSDFMVGEPDKVARIYEELNTGKTFNEIINNLDKKSEVSDKEVEEKNAKIDLKITQNDKKITLDFQVLPKKDLTNSEFTIFMKNSYGNAVFRWASYEELEKNFEFKKGKEIDFKLELDNILPNGNYYLDIGIKKLDRTKDYVSLFDFGQFEVIKSGKNLYYFEIPKRFKSDGLKAKNERK